MEGKGREEEQALSGVLTHLAASLCSLLHMGRD